MSTIVRARRVSPKARRLARDHDLRLRAVPGTGAGGRVTANDVLRAAGEPRAPLAGTVLASPVARLLLREAGIDPAHAASESGGRRLTRARAQRLVAEVSPADGPRRPSAAAPSGDGAGTTHDELDVDVAELLARVAAADAGFVARHGFELGLEVPVGAAAATILAERRSGAGVVVGFHTAGDDVRTVADAQDLNVSGLARRARAAEPGPIADPDREPPTTITITTDPTAPVGALLDHSEVGVVVLGEPVDREACRTDHLGHEVVRTRPHVQVRLHHRRQVPDEEAAAVLAALGEALTAWTRPVAS